MAIRVVTKLADNNSNSNSNSNNEDDGPAWRHLRTRTLIVVALACCVLLFVQIASVAEEKGASIDVVQVRAKVIERTVETAGGGGGRGRGRGGNSVSGETCLGICSARTKARAEKFNGNLLDRAELLRMAKQAKEKLIETLKEDYGQYFEPIFVRPGNIFTPISEDGPSMDRLKRKLTIKVLEVQANILQQDKNVADSCDCTAEGGGETLETKAKSVDTEDSRQIPESYARYVWATGGHSAAAGHGNLFSESYTAYMGRDVRIVFGAIGIEFEDRNYAMGGTKSGSEISMCWQQIFGADVDFFSWDYGMTDGNTAQTMMHYGYRGGLSPNAPAFLGMKVGGRARKSREGTLKVLEEHGMATFYGSDAAYSLRNAGVPDSAGITKDEIDALPKLVRNLRCGEQLENGDPFCREEKFSFGDCPVRAKQTAWHPGFKMHALDGHSLGLFLVDSLIDALTDLTNHKTTDTSALLIELQTQEHAIHEQLRKTDLPGPTVSSLYIPDKKAPTDPTLDMNLLWQGPSICRSARLPAQSRYLGYTTNTDTVGEISVLGSETYDVGTPVTDASKATTGDGSMVLVYEAGGKDRQTCKVILKPDYKDFFYTKKAYGLSKFSMPNEREREAYGYDPAQYKGLIVLVFVTCDWGKCQKGELRPEDFPEDKYEVSVNGKPVTGLLSAGFEAWILKGEDGLYWQPDSSSGTFDVGFLVKDDAGFIKLSSIIVY